MLHHLNHRIINTTEYAKPNIAIVGVLGFFGFPLYYYIWQYIYPQQYENLEFRILCSILFLPFIFYTKIPTALHSRFPKYFFYSLFICLPYFFSFMLIKNSYSSIWVMSFISAIYLLILLVYDWILICLMLFFGFILASLTVILSSKSPYNNINQFDFHYIFSGFDFSYIPVILFAVFGGMVCNYRSEIHNKKRIYSLKSLGGSIAHEMRNPLFNAKMILHQISNNNSHEENKILVDMGNQSINRSQQLIDIILSQINENKIKKSRFDNLQAFATVKKSIDNFTFEEDEEKKIVKIINEEDFSFKGKETLFTYLMFNLLRNSLYFLKEVKNPQITIWIKKNKIVFRDNGIGINKKQKKKIFDNFTSNRIGGTGLGLAFCERTMESFGGYIKCNSELGKFTEFILKFS